MSDLRTIVERISGPDAIRRVERDESAQNFGQRNRDKNSGGKPPSQPPAEEETPHDVVEVSADYHPAHLSLPSPTVPPASPALLPARRARASNATGAKDAPPSTPTERHIDIQV